MWSDREVLAKIEACLACIRSGHKNVLMPAEKLAMALRELLVFREQESRDLERVGPAVFDGDQPS